MKKILHRISEKIPLWLLFFLALTLLLLATSVYGAETQNRGEKEQAETGSTAQTVIPNSPSVIPNEPNSPNSPAGTNLPNSPNSPVGPNSVNNPNTPNSPNETNNPNGPNQPNSPNGVNVPNDSNSPNSPNVPNSPNTPNTLENTEDWSGQSSSSQKKTGQAAGRETDGSEGRPADEEISEQTRRPVLMYVVLLFIAAAVLTGVIIWKKRKK